MSELSLYPRTENLVKAGVLGVISLSFGQSIMSINDEGFNVLPYFFIGLALFLFYKIAMAVLKPTPSFFANVEGFSVHGGKLHDWSSFHGVKVKTIYLYFFPVSRSIEIKTTKARMGKRETIHAMHMSGSAKEMTAQIAAYAGAVQRADAMHAAFSAGGQPSFNTTQRPQASDVEPLPSPLPEPQVAMASKVAPPKVTDGGPVQSVPSMSERLFRQRKVI